MTKPLILVTADIKMLDGYRWHSVNEFYLKAVASVADAVPVILPALGADIDLDSALDQADGVLATGSKSNVNPELYGREATEANGPYDPDRDSTSLPLLKKAVERGIPMFAICRGMQELNVAYGGTLQTEIQELDGRFDHRAPVSEIQAERFRLAHQIEITTGGVLASLVGDAPIQVNSLHRQAVGALGNGLVVEARADDGTIEAMSIERSPAYTVATQWHPEYWASDDAPSRKLFEAFGDAARKYRERRKG